MSRYPQTPYDVIYLQYFEGGEPAPEISWCEDKINDDDIKYVKNGVPATYVRELEAEAVRVKAERDTLLKALIRVKSGTCFCDVGIGVSLRHTPECDYAMSVLAESEAIAAANEATP